MRILLSLFLFTFSIQSFSDGHLPAEKEVLESLSAYFEARTNQDWDKVVSYESKSGTFGTNSDGSFHKPKVIQSADDWANSGQAGVINIYYPEAIQISDDVVFVRFYYELSLIHI